MKKLFLISGVAAMVFGLAACKGNGSDKDLKTFGDSLSYYMGQQIGLGLNQQISSFPEEEQAKIKPDAFLLGLKTVLESDTANDSYLQGLGFGLQMMQQISGYEKAGVEFDRDMFFEQLKKGFKADTVDVVALDLANIKMQSLGEKAMNQMMAYQMAERQRIMEEQNKKFEANKKAGKEYIEAQMKADKDIKQTESGLAYKVTKMGTGTVAVSGSKVKVKYTGKLIDGKEFDSSKGQPVEFNTRGVVPGFSEALTTFPVGSVVTIYVPENLGYGQQGSGKIEPGSTIVFDLEICEVEAPADKAAKKEVLDSVANAKQ